jgi:hypothetical protein
MNFWKYAKTPDADSIRRARVYLIVLEVAVEIPAEAACADKNDSQVEFVPDTAESFHVVAEVDAYPGEEIAPD